MTEIRSCGVADRPVPELSAEFRPVVAATQCSSQRPINIVIVGDSRARRRAAGRAIGQLLAAQGITASASCARLRAIDLLGYTLPPPGISMLRTWDTAGSGVVMVEDVDAFVGPLKNRASFQCPAAMAVIGTILEVTERPDGPVICLADCSEAIDRLFAADRALGERFDLRVHC